MYIELWGFLRRGSKITGEHEMRGRCLYLYLIYVGATDTVITPA